MVKDTVWFPLLATEQFKPEWNWLLRWQDSLKMSWFNYYVFTQYLAVLHNSPFQNCQWGVPLVAQQKRTWLVSWPCSVGQGSNIAVSCGIGHRRGSDPSWLWLWLWLWPAAVAPIRPLAWEPPWATGAALKIWKKKKDGRGFSSSLETR